MASIGRSVSPIPRTCEAVEVRVDAVHVLHGSGVGMLAFEGRSGVERVHAILSIDLDPVTGEPTESGSMHFEWCDQSRSGYDLVKSATWIGDDLQIRTGGIAKELGIPDGMTMKDVASRIDPERRRTADVLLGLI